MMMRIGGILRGVKFMIYEAICIPFSTKRSKNIKHVIKILLYHKYSHTVVVMWPFFFCGYIWES